MKNEGFTLVELLAVLVLIAALSLVVFPSIINYINQSKGEINEATKKLVFAGSEQYINNNRGLAQEQVGIKYCIDINDLVSEGYLDESINNEADIANKFVEASYEEDSKTGIKSFKYDLVDECN